MGKGKKKSLIMGRGEPESKGDEEGKEMLEEMVGRLGQKGNDGRE